MCIDNQETLEMHDVAYYLRQFHISQQEKEKSFLESIKGRLIFRGLADTRWNVVSSAGRRLLDEEMKDKQNDFVRYHINLIANARKFGYGGLQSGSQLNDLEILAEIQHYGGATCLTDFTTNFLIALWFATEKSSDWSVKKDIENKIVEKTEYPQENVNGKVIWLDLGDENNFNKITYYNKYVEGDTIQRILTKVDSNFESKQRKVEPCFWLWEPTKLNNRIIMQNSVFLFGLTAFPTSNELNASQGKNNEKLNVKQIIIEANDKENVRDELERIFGISAETVYFDLSGYSLNANGSSVSVNEKILPKNECLYNAKESIKEKQYSVAISYLDEAITCIKNNCEVYNDCSDISINESKNDFTENNSCKRSRKSFCNQSIGELLFWRGVASEGKDNLDDALLNYYEATKILLVEPKSERIYKILCECYRKRAILNYQKHNYIGAIKTVQDLKSLHHDFEKSNDGSGVDAYFELIELSILTLNNEMFNEHLKNARNIISEESNNGTLLFLFLESIGNMIFSKIFDQDEFDSILGKIDKLTHDLLGDIKSKSNHINLSKDKFLGYYYWNFIDIIKWIEDIQKHTNIQKKIDAEKKTYKMFISENADNLILMAKKTDNAQDKLLNKVFIESVAVR